MQRAAKHRSANASPHASGPAYPENAYATMTDSHSRESVQATRRILVFFALLALLTACCALTWHIAWQRGIDELRRNAAARVDRTTSTLKSTLDRYEYLPYLLSRHPFVQDVLAAPDARNVDRANRYLEDLNRRSHATATYLIRADG